MKLFGQIVRTVVNTVMLPVDVARDIVTLGGVVNGHGSYTAERIETLKEEAEED